MLTCRIRNALFVGAAMLFNLATHAGEMTLFSRGDFGGREITLRDATPNLIDMGFNDKASSMQVRSGRWEVCSDVQFRGECAIFERGDYRTLDRFNNRISSAREVGTGRDRASARREHGRRGMLELFAQPGLNGNSTRLVSDSANLGQVGFNDRAASVVIEEGSWQLCSDVEFRGNCRVFAPGRYDDLGGLSGQVSSARLLGAADVAPLPPPAPEENAAVLLYREDGLRGRAVGLRNDASDFNAFGFNDMAASMVITRGTWEFCTDNEFRGQCRILGPGQYRSLDPMLMRAISSARQVAPQRSPSRPEGAIELFSAADFGGERLSLRRDSSALTELDFNDRAGSIIVHAGQWEFCTNVEFGGQCVVYGPGRYGRLGAMNNAISSLRRVR